MKHAHDHFRFVRVPTSGALALLNGEPQGLGLTFEGLDGRGQVAVRDTTTPANNLFNAPIDSLLTQSGTSPKLVLWSDGLYRWSQHNLALNSENLTASGWTAGGSAVLGVSAVSGLGTGGDYAFRSFTSIAGATYTAQFRLSGSGTVSIGFYDNGTFRTTLVTLTATPTDYFFAATMASTADERLVIGTVVAGNATSVTVTRAQLNRGTTPTTYHVTTSAAWFGVPIEYDPVTAKFYALVEPAATNLALQSRAIGVAPWTALNGPSVTANTAAGPDGTVTADTVTFPASASAEYYQAVTLATSTTYQASVFAKVASGTKAFRFNKYDGTGGASTNSSDMVATTTPLRFSWSFATNGTDTTGANVALINSSDAAAGDVIFSDYQLELGSVATSPIPTFAATVTRAGDNPFMTQASFPYSDAAGTYIIRFQPRTSAGAASAIIRPDVGAPLATRNFATGVDSYDGTSTTTLSTAALSTTSPNKAAIAWSGVTTSGAVNGAAVVTGTYDGSWNGATNIGIGVRFGTGGEQLNGRILSVVYVPRRMTDAELQAKTL